MGVAGVRTCGGRKREAGLGEVPPRLHELDVGYVDLPGGIHALDHVGSHKTDVGISGDHVVNDLTEGGP